METLFKIDEEQRQMILLAIAELAVRRPGWDLALGSIAGELGGREMFEKFKLCRGIVKALAGE